MKIHGTAKGGAIGKKDFGVAFSGGAAPEPEPVFEEDYESTDDWTFAPTSGNAWSIDAGGNGLLLGTNVPDNNSEQVYRSMGVNLASEFTLKIEYKPTSDANSIYPFCVSYNSTHVNSQTRGIGVKANGGSQLTLFSVSSGSFTQSSYNTSMSKDTQYYIKIVNDDSNITMSIFENSDYESDQVGSDVSITDPNFTDLGTLQHCSQLGGGGATASIEIANFSVFDDT